MASVKVKFRPSAIMDREGTIYYQIIHERIPRQLLTDYHILSSEWDEKRASISSIKSGRNAFLNTIKEHIRWDIDLLNKIIRRFEDESSAYTSDEIIEEFKRSSSNNSLFNFMKREIARLKNNGKIRTSETYQATLRSFMKYRQGSDMHLGSITANIMEGYQAWLHQQGLSPILSPFI